jgi:riboflavin-specific deaminase-like protein
VRRLVGQPLDDAEVEAAYVDLAGRRVHARPYVVVNMVASVDGAIAVQGRTDGLSTRADRMVFHFLRSLADVILVGAQTVRAEGYGPPKLREDERARRLARGQSEYPRIAVVTRSLALDWRSPLFQQPTSRPLVVVPGTAEEATVARAGEVADVVVAGESAVDLAAALDALAGAGVGLVLCEGGPTLNASLAEAGLFDELCLTLAPSLVGGDEVFGLIGAARLLHPLPLVLVHVLEEDGFLFLRYTAGPAR